MAPTIEAKALFAVYSLRRLRFARAAFLIFLIWLIWLIWAADRRAAAAPPVATATQLGQGALGTYVRGPAVLAPGTPAALRIAAHLATSETQSTPAAQVQVQVRLQGQGRAADLYSGQTDASGIADALFTVPLWPPGSYSLAVTSRRGELADASTHDVTLTRSGRLLVQSDKPMYQPSQVIHLRAIALRSQDGHPIASGQVLFEVSDPRDNKVFSATRALSAYGIAAVDVPLADDLLLGAYKIRGELVNEQPGAPEKRVREPTVAPSELAVTVSRYVLPRFQLSLHTDRAYYTQGATVQVSLAGRYFHGRPVAGANVEIVVSAMKGPEDGVSTRFAVLQAKLDDKGEGQVSFPLPKEILWPQGYLRLQASAEDAAGQRESASHRVLVSRRRLRVAIIAEAGQLIAGMDNQVFVVASHPDGSPAAGAELELWAGSELPADDKDIRRARADALGVATFPIRATPQWAQKKQGGCALGDVQLWAHAQLPSGLDSDASQCLRVESAGLRLRTDRAIYAQGQPLQLDVEAPGLAGVAYVDILKEGQLVSTAAMPLTRGAGHLTLPADVRRFGTLALRAYHHASNGALSHDERVVYVERPSSLRVEVRPQTEPDGTLRPGSTGRIHLRVVDTATASGVQAAVGLVMVDEALLALHPLVQGLTRAFFNLSTLPKTNGQYAQPGGLTLEQLLQDQSPEQDPDALRQQAARILLAGAAPDWKVGWEVNPWQLREQARGPQLERVVAQLDPFRRTHRIGERVPGTRDTWRYRLDLSMAMAASGALEQKDARDPWGRPVSVDAVIELAGLPKFPEYAQAELAERMTAIYAALEAERAAGRLAADPSVSGPRPAVLISDADLERLVAEHKLPAGRLYDAWENRFHLVERKLPFQVGRVFSRFFLASDGPDGVRGSPDDLVARDRSCEGAAAGSRVVGEHAAVIGVPAAAAFRPFTSAGECATAFSWPRVNKIGHFGGRRVGVPDVVAGMTALSPWPDEPGRVRSVFPETLLWRPELLTDASGNALLEVGMADSITTWRLRAEALSLDGRMGEAALPVRVYKDLFVDLELPPVLTQHDELAVPVTVYNYTKAPQQVRLELADVPGFERLAETTQRIDLPPSQIGVRFFRVRARAVGRQRLQVRAIASGPGGPTDAIDKAVEVRPDGMERSQAFQDRLRAGAALHHRYEVPAAAIAGTGKVSLKLYPSSITHAVEGLDSLLRVPSGCFEQTSSTVYPNVLILQYLRQVGRSSPALEKKAAALLQLGYQRLLTFEVRGGGFSLFGHAPASKVLSAFGLEELHDMSRVYPVDAKLLERTQRFLLSRQRSDGSFAADGDAPRGTAPSGEHGEDLRTTAYIALALRHTQADEAAVKRAAEYVRTAFAQAPTRDPYTLALVADLLGGDLMERLWETRTETGSGAQRTVSFTPREVTLLHDAGRSATIETTAMAAELMLRSGDPGHRADAAINYLRANMDDLGTWHSTQATLQTLKALLRQAQSRPAATRGAVLVQLDGRPVQRVVLDGNDALRQLDLAAAARPGRHDLELRFEGSGDLSYHLLASYYEPIAAPSAPASAEPLTQLLERSPTPRADALAVTCVVDEPQLAVGEPLYEQLRVRTNAPLDLPLVVAGIPPGFTVDLEHLDTMVQSRVIEKYEVHPQDVTFYLRALRPGKPTLLPLRLTARLAGRMRVPAPTVYEYYQPEHRAVGQPVLLTVSPAKGP